ncbi:MAG: tyrosine decarboxylase MfnA [Candidatus Heimdallarchaeaceae archaeon]
MEPKIEDIIEALTQELAEDCSYYSGKIFGSMSTYPIDAVIKVYCTFIEKNAGDPNIFYGTHKLELAVISLLGQFFNAHTAAGNIVSGGSEGNIIGLWAARNYMKKHKQYPLNKKLQIIIPETRHASIDKAVDLLDLEAVIAPTNEFFEVDVKEVEELITDRTVAIVGIAGNTVYGAIDNIERLSKITLEHDVWLHVDAAFGGFVIPFLTKKYKFDFVLEGVKSLVADPHKMGGAPIPTGCILFRNELLSREIIHHLPYFSGQLTESRTVIGTKPGASVIATYYILKWKGIKWIKQRAMKSLNNAKYLKSELEKRGFEIMGKAELNVFSCLPPEEYANKRSIIFKKGWRIGNYGDLWRFVVMPTINKENIDNFLGFLDKL